MAKPKNSNPKVGDGVRGTSSIRVEMNDVAGPAVVKRSVQKTTAKPMGTTSKGRRKY